MQRRFMLCISTILFFLITANLDARIFWLQQEAQKTAKSDSTKKTDTPKKKEWDVTAAHGPTSLTEFATTEGTWMNLDVSPDGKEIVFDLKIFVC